MSDRPLEDWEYPDPDDEQDDEEEDTVACPQCGEQIYEHADRCPYCGEFVVPETGTNLAGRPWWYVVLALLGIGAVIALLLQVFGQPPLQVP